MKVQKRKAHKELSKGNKVKLIVQFKGHEIASLQDVAREMLRGVYGHVEDVGTWEQEPKMQGRSMLAVVVPKI
jgi:translation initiation factor IF-3